METSHLTLWEKIKILPWMIVLWVWFGLIEFCDRIKGVK